MSKTEDYLDSLLNNVTPERKAESKRKRRKRKTNFEEDFENELSGMGTDGFAEDLGEAGDSFFDDLEGIINQVNDTSVDEFSESPDESPVEDEFEINTLIDDAWTEEEPHPKEDNPAVEFVENTDELDELLAEENSARGKNGEASGKEKKPGFFKKLGSALFGEDEDDLQEEAAEPEMASDTADGGGYAGLDEEQLQILKDLDMAGAEELSVEPEEQQKGKKKKEKKMKKEKKAKEKKPKEKKPKKVKKPKKEKSKKEKAPRKPKAVDLSPPLPKAPVILIFIMAVSAGAFVLISSHLTGYSSSIAAAKKAYAAQDYVEAYHQMAGLEPKEEDEELNSRITLLAGVQGEINKGNALYESKQYAMALDAYICALGRHGANSGEASVYGVQAEYDMLASQAESQAAEKFGIDAKTAQEIYGLKDRTEYTIRVYNIVKALGL